MNIYKQILKQNINKLLSLYNTDKFSKTYGYGDRECWGWKTKDFTNGTLQGGIHSLAISLKLNLFNEAQKNYIVDVIDSSILAVEQIRDKNGSLVEAYPGENSFCVTALVAFDLLSAIKYLDKTITKKKKESYIDIIRPLINFVINNDEEHAIISNHLAAGVAAITYWNEIAIDTNNRHNELLDIIYENQSDEGWYKEYEGADPGYQTLCTYYLSCAYEVTKDKKLLSSLKKSAKFISHFVHPDGTIGGLYGSRNTEVFYPAGIINLSSVIKEFAMMAKYLEPNGQQILPQNIDIGNYIPAINSYAVAAINYEKNKDKIELSSLEPFYKNKAIKDYQQTGIFLYSNTNYFVVINYKKGGTLKVFDKKTNVIDLEDGGLWGILESKEKFCTQKFDEKICFTNKKIICGFYKINESSPNVINFIVLRFFSLTLFKSVFFGNFFKRIIVNMLMTGKSKIGGEVEREFQFLENKIVVKEKIKMPEKCKEIKHIGKSRAIHMASSGYFLSQNYANNKSNLVEFLNV